MSATYLYAIIPTTAPLLLDGMGVGDDGEIHTLAHQGLTAVIGASPLKDYHGLRRDLAVRYLVAHQRVVETIMASSPVLPVKFGTTLPDEAAVQRCLAQGAPLLSAALEQVASQVQMEVVVLWNLQEVFQEIAAEPAVAQLRDELAARPDTATVAARAALGHLVQERLVQRRTELGGHLLSALCQSALDVVTNPLLNDSMVINIALLLNKADRQVLDEQVERLDAEFDGRLTFRCIGPLPPYSFATVELQTLSFEAVDAARCRLGLEARATLGEIRRAYHRLAGQVHPDHQPNAVEATAEMTALSQAHELLQAYGASWVRQNDASPDSPCCFGRETVEQTLLIRVRRQELAP